MKTPPAPAKPRRLEDMSTGRGGHFRFTLDQLTIPEGYNPRTEFHGIPELAESILAESTDEVVGLLNPLRVRKVKGTETIEVLDGERRFRALKHLVAKGHKLGLIPCIPEQQGTTDLQRDLVPLVANTGQELTFLEKARQYQRLIERHGIKPAELARRCQTTKQAVSDALRLVNEATPLLLSHVAGGKMSGTTALAIIRQAQASGQEIDTLATLTEQAADAAGSDHITPKHIPTPDPLAGVSLIYHKRDRAGSMSIGKRKDGQQLWAERCISAKLIPDSRTEATIGWNWDDQGIWTVGYYFAKGAAASFRENYALCADNYGEKAARHPDLRDALVGVIALAVKFHDWDSKMHTAFESAALGLLKEKDFRNSKMKEAPADPEETGGGESESPTQPESPTDHSAPGTDHSAATPQFTLYQIEDAPADPIKGTTTYHETDRLVLTPLVNGTTRLHLLCAFAKGKFAYGYRLGDTEQLPDTSAASHGKEIDQGFRMALDAALEGAEITAEDSDDIADALFNALGDYYPEEGEGKQPEPLAFTPPGQEPETGYKAIINAPSSNRDGSAPGKGEGGFSAPDKQMEKIDNMLDAIAEKGNGHEDRITTANLILNVLRNESSTLTLRSHLTGK